MPDLRRATCQRCRRHKSVCGPISWGGLCQECSVERVTGNVIAMATKSQPALLEWRRAMAASIGAILIDDLPSQH